MWIWKCMNYKKKKNHQNCSKKTEKCAEKLNRLAVTWSAETVNKYCYMKKWVQNKCLYYNDSIFVYKLQQHCKIAYHNIIIVNTILLKCSMTKQFPIDFALIIIMSERLCVCLYPIILISQERWRLNANYGVLSLFIYLFEIDDNINDHKSWPWYK